MTFETHLVSRANKTSRNSGAVGAKAITPKYVQQIATTGETILDFGAGKDAPHTKRLVEAGLNVVAHDFGSNLREGVHDLQALDKTYDIVYASNVLNTQSSYKMMDITLYQIRDVVKAGGKAIFNFPLSPRFYPDHADGLASKIADIFGAFPVRVGGTRQAPLWEVIKP